ncbi:GIY-YIG nuclease family protein [uncultured Aquimarina sp.]|uniref:GIY-YIG nuclease family protein n=1 Tax=uncultured Aquimarina sp. TaxID=575652 RepID=UPI00261BBA62|nr:GIY-YIG nuclease family protein [uncultured Aquimarina sp.]
MYTVYILFSSSNDKYYVGHTSNLEDRVKRHNQGRSKSTKTGIPWKVVYTENYQSKSEAYQREVKIKKQKSRKYIEQLIKSAR